MTLVFSMPRPCSNQHAQNLGMKQQDQNASHESKVMFCHILCATNTCGLTPAGN